MADKVVSIEWNQDQFSQFLTEFGSSVNIEAETFIKKMALDLLGRIVSRTPVDTGRARAGWSAAGKALGMQIPAAPTSQGGDSEYTEQFSSDMKLIRMTNNVNYIIFLEYGSSKQAPLGMLRISMLEMQSEQNIAVQELERNLKDLWGGMKQPERFAQQGASMATLISQTPTGRLATTLNAVRAARRQDV